MTVVSVLPADQEIPCWCDYWTAAVVAVSVNSSPGQSDDLGTRQELCEILIRDNAVDMLLFFDR